MLLSPESPIAQENISSVKKITGNELKAKTLERELAERYAKQDIPEIKGREKEKTPEEIQIIEYINKQLNTRLKKYGLPEMNVLSKHIRILNEKFYNETIEMLEQKQEKSKPLAEKLYSEPFEKENKTAAKFIPELQTIFIKETDSLAVFFHRCFHELTEFNSYQEMEASDDGAKVRQLGISFITKSGEKRLENLKEAIIEELNKKEFYESVNKNPNSLQPFQKEVSWTEKRKIDLLSKVKDESLREQIGDILFIPLFSLIPPETEKPSYDMFGSHEERKALNNLVKKITEKNPNFKNSEQVMELFFQSLFTGKYEWKELIEKTFGQETFEKLAKSDRNPQELEKFVNGL